MGKMLHMYDQWQRRCSATTASTTSPPNHRGPRRGPNLQRKSDVKHLTCILRSTTPRYGPAEASSYMVHVRRARPLLEPLCYLYRFLYSSALCIQGPLRGLTARWHSPTTESPHTHSSSVACSVWGHHPSGACVSNSNEQAVIPINPASSLIMVPVHSADSTLGRPFPVVPNCHHNLNITRPRP